MSDQRNMILAIVLSAIVLFGWSFISERYFPTATPPTTKVVEGKQVPLPQPGADPAADTASAVRDRAQVMGETPRVAIETPSLQGSINLRGARIDDLTLTRYRESLSRTSPPIRLLSPAGAPNAYFASFGWSGQGLAVPGPDTVWQASGNRLTPATPVTLSWSNGQGQRFDIRIAIDDQYLFTVDQTVSNAGAGPVAVRPYGLLSRVGKSADPDSWTVHVGPMGVFNGAANYGPNFSDLDEEREQRFSSSSGGWLGFGDKYWLAALVPQQSGSFDAAFRTGRADSYQADFTTDPAIVAPGKAVRYESRLFAGAKEEAVLETYATSIGTRLDKAIDWGWFEWFMKPIFSLLHWLFLTLGNFGVAIICLTLIVRLAMFPIAQKQFASMAKMRVVQPKMQALQERHKDDKPRLQQEMLKLYQEEGVNPLAGCLPILLQIPIFYALYKVLLVSVEMRHQPFVLWIKDLSAPDPLTPVNLFGFLPFTPPTFLAIGILPILLGITQFIQFRLTPVQDPVQRQVFAIMPWVFVFIMAPFAAGLQLYWVISNLLTIAQQKFLYSRYPGMKAAMAADKK